MNDRKILQMPTVQLKNNRHGKIENKTFNIFS
jgi:hypothetical protein